MNENVAVLLLLFALSIIDITKREVPHWGVLILFVFSLVAVDDYSSSFFWCLYAFLGLSLVYFISKGAIGGGDVKLLAALAFYLGAEFVFYLGYFSFVSCLGFLIGFLYYRSTKISLPLVPFVFSAFLLWSI